MTDGASSVIYNKSNSYFRREQ